MSLEHRIKMRKNHVALATEMQVEQLLPHFFQEVGN